MQPTTQTHDRLTAEQLEAELRSTAAGRAVLKNHDALVEARQLEELGVVLLESTHGAVEAAERNLTQAQVAGIASSTARARSSVIDARQSLARARTKLARFRANRERIDAKLAAAARGL
jgi:hypothetical protein